MSAASSINYNFSLPANRRCSNRVVEKGLTTRLEVFRVAQDLPADGSISVLEAATSNTWGVRTLDFIPKGGFVCEITGQYVLGKTRDRLVRILLF